MREKELRETSSSLAKAPMVDPVAGEHLSILTNVKGMMKA
jgi:hypothetical protein